MLAQLALEPVMPRGRPALEEALGVVRAAVADGVTRCDQLLRSFSKHLPLLDAEPLIISQLVDMDRAVMTSKDWIDMVQKYRCGTRTRRPNHPRCSQATTPSSVRVLFWG